MRTSALDLNNGTVDLSHGSGGRAMNLLIEHLFARHFRNPLLDQKNDQAVTPPPHGRLAISTDSYVISPLFFPGGNIGSLAVHGTVNDVAMCGAQVLYLSAGFILEEGFPLRELEQIARSMAQAAQEAGVMIVTGDTKVVPRGKADGVFITTTGVGVVANGIDISGDRARPGCKILINGSIGDHGVAVMASREHLQFGTTLVSDSAALNGLIGEMLAAVPQGIRCLRDPTRGGLAATLNELAQQSAVGMILDETQIPVKADVKAACEILGLDPLYIANEGKLVCICEADAADTLLDIMRTHRLGREAAIIGEVVEDALHFVEMRTAFGGRRMVDSPLGEQLPRIC